MCNIILIYIKSLVELYFYKLIELDVYVYVAKSNNSTIIKTGIYTAIIKLIFDTNDNKAGVVRSQDPSQK